LQTINSQEKAESINAARPFLLILGLKSQMTLFVTGYTTNKARWIFLWRVLVEIPWLTRGRSRTRLRTFGTS
jgi:hypothetical protein